jgi:UrcA family protein
MTAKTLIMHAPWLARCERSSFARLPERINRVPSHPACRNLALIAKETVRLGQPFWDGLEQISLQGEEFQIMIIQSVSRLACRAALVAGVLGLALSPALGQNYGGPEEGVIVTAPRFHVEGNPMRNVPEKISLSTQVRYDDLNLISYQGAQTLRWRVRDAAQDVCTQVAEAYPVYQAPGTSCYRKALQGGLIRADAAIRDARDRYYYGY